MKRELEQAIKAIDGALGTRRGSECNGNCGSTFGAGCWPADLVIAGKALRALLAPSPAAEFHDRLATIVDEQIGIQPVLSTEDLLTALEHGLFELRQRAAQPAPAADAPSEGRDNPALVAEIERLRRALDARVANDARRLSAAIDAVQAAHPAPTPDVRSARDVAHDLANTYDASCMDHEVLGWSHSPACDKLTDAIERRDREHADESLRPGLEAAERIAREMPVPSGNPAARVGFRIARIAFGRLIRAALSETEPGKDRP